MIKSRVPSISISSTLITCLIFWALFLMPEVATARLVVPGPDQMLKDAQIIVTGKVTKLELTPEVKDGYRGTIDIENILKGEVTNKNIILTERRYMFSKAWLQRIPPVGTDILLLLRRNESGNPDFFVDGNHIAIIQDNKVVAVYKGINQNLPYVEKYKQFYQVQLSRIQKPQPSAEKQKIKESNMTNYIIIAIVIVTGVFFMVKALTFFPKYFI